MKLKCYLFLLSCIVLASCVDIPDYSEIPHIDYNGISQETEYDTTISPCTGKPQEVVVVTLTINFEDGDGDLGLTAAQSQDSTVWKQYESVPGWGYQANYEIVTMTPNKDGTWSESVLPGDSFKFFKILKPDGRPGPINGKLDHNIRYPYGCSMTLQKRKFKIRIIDRAFHISNQTLESDEVLVPAY